MTQPDQLPFYTRRQYQAAIPLLLCTGSIIPIAKPLDWTSFDVVNHFRIKVKQVVGLKKIKTGHAGTLDPKATGLLLLATGRATKLIEVLMGQPKCYLTTIKLGATTPSFDREQEEDATYPWQHITRPQLEESLQQFIGEIEQVPPLFSAISINGKRAYKHARKGQEVEMPIKRVHIHSLEITSFEPPLVSLCIVCSRGTYIRSLARDLGVALGSGAYLTALARIRIGNISLEDAFTLEELPNLLALAPQEEEGFQ